MNPADLTARDQPWFAAARDPRCWLRPCFHADLNYGVYAQGKGYTHVYRNPELVCMQRHLHGCPRQIPQADPGRARCCLRPLYRGSQRYKRVTYRECQGCGAVAPSRIATLRNALPRLGVDCEHRQPREGCGGHICDACGGWWDHTPLRHEEPQRPHREVLDEYCARLAAALRKAEK